MKTGILTLFIILNLSFIQKAVAQNVSINADGSLPDTSAMLDVSSTTKGLLLPRMTTTQQNAIILPAKGLSIFNTTLNSVMINTGTALSPVWSGVAAGAIDTSSIANFSVKVRSLFSSTAPITYNNGLIGITQATTSINGYLSSTDWNTFNNKQPQLNGTGFVKASGTTITYDNSTYLTGNQTISFVPTGDITGSTTGTTTLAPALVIGANKVLNTMLAQMPTLTIKGNNTGGTANALDLSVAQVNAILPVFTATLNGLVPFSGGAAGKVLHGDGTWKDTTAANNQWSITGNTGTTSVTNFIGTTDNKSFKIKTNNTQGFLLDSLQNVGIGTSPSFTATPNMEKLLVDAGTSANPTTSYNVISGKGYIDNYLQLNIQNRAGTASASSDVVASNDAATEAINYIDMGVNSSGNTSTGILGGANTGYLYSTGGDFAVGNAISGKSLLFFTGGTASGNERMHITSGGNVGVGTTTPNSTFQTNGSVALSIVTQTGNYSATASDYTIVMNNSSPKTVTLPTAVGITGRIYVIKKISATLISSTIATTSSQTIDGAATKTLTLQYTQITVQSDGANWIILSN